MRAVFLLLPALLLTGCDKFSGESDQKIYDAEAIGYACRISQKKPEDCMKENEAQSPSSVLDGWKAADKDIREKVIDVNMGARPLIEGSTAESTEAATVPEAAAVPDAAPATPATAPAVGGEAPKLELPKIEDAGKQ